MMRFKILVLFLLLGKLLVAQSFSSKFTDYYTKSYLLPLSLNEFIIDGPIYKEVDSIEMITNDTIKIRISFINNKITCISSDSVSLEIKYRFGKVVKSGGTKIIHLFPYILIPYNGSRIIMYKGFGKVNKAKLLSGLNTISKTKIHYEFRRISKIKIYGWNTVAQKCYYTGFSKFSYPNDSTVIERYFEKKDSLANETIYIFDKLGNIKEINELIKKRYIGWGIDVTYYAYNGNDVDSTRFEYSFDENNNWIKRQKYLNGNLKEKVTRNLYYKNNKP